MWKARVKAICPRAHGTGFTSEIATSSVRVADTIYPSLTPGIVTRPAPKQHRPYQVTSPSAGRV